MNITEIKIRKTFDENVLKAIVSITFDNCFTVHDIKVVYANERLFVVMPNKKSKDGRTADIAHPINSEFRGIIESNVLSAYLNYIQKSEHDIKVD